MTLADCTVMVVEDHEFQRRTMLQILANLGAGHLLEAEDGEQALALLAGHPKPDVVVVDLDMPGMDGVEFLRHMAERSLDTAIVIASGLDDGVLRAAESTARAYGLEVLGAVPKPLTARRLLEVVGLHRPRVPKPGADAGGAATNAWLTALRAEEITVALLPRVDLLTGRPAGLQARAWRGDNGHGPVDAATDLSASASPEVAAGIAELVLDVACEALRELDGAALGLDATIVIPPAACSDLTLSDRLASRAQAAGVHPRRLCVALPREPALPVTAAQLDVLTRLRVRGFGLGVDGFATGEATLGGPDGLPLTEVMLARDAVSGAADPGATQRVEALDATIRALREQGVRVVADGCDAAGERDLVAQLGADRAQGRVIGAPLAIEQLAAWAGAAPR
ncbi:MAG: EAL domain-containing protein [Solirubrobacteraceae bacterium]|nr:EAL domain-containing protein [Solirubrobacteraceae bacterium]